MGAQQTKPRVSAKESRLIWARAYCKQKGHSLPDDADEQTVMQKLLECRHMSMQKMLKEFLEQLHFSVQKQEFSWVEQRVIYTIVVPGKPVSVSLSFSYTRTNVENAIWQLSIVTQQDVFGSNDLALGANLASLAV